MSILEIQNIFYFAVFIQIVSIFFQWEKVLHISCKLAVEQ